MSIDQQQGDEYQEEETEQLRSETECAEQRRRQECGCTVYTSLFDLCDECSNKAWAAGSELASRDIKNPAWKGNDMTPWGEDLQSGEQAIAREYARISAINERTGSKR